MGHPTITKVCLLKVGKTVHSKSPLVNTANAFTKRLWLGLSTVMDPDGLHAAKTFIVNIIIIIITIHL